MALIPIDQVGQAGIVKDILAGLTIQILWR